MTHHIKDLVSICREEHNCDTCINEYVKYNKEPCKECLSGKVCHWETSKKVN